MRLQPLLLILLGLSLATHAAMGQVVVLDFTSGTITEPNPMYYPPLPTDDPTYLGGGTEYIEKGVTVTSLNAPAGGFPCFFLDTYGLNLAMESGPVEFSAGGRPFDVISLDAWWIGDPGVGPYTFTSSKGGSVTVGVDGTYTFPTTSKWQNVTSFQWIPDGFGQLDNVVLNIVPEPSTISLLIIGGFFLLAAARRKGR